MVQFKALTFNMQFGQIWDRENPNEVPIRLDTTIEEIRSHNADIVLLQEVERVEPEKGQVNPPPNYTSIRRALPQHDGFFEYPPSDERELPLASAWPY